MQIKIRQTLKSQIKKYIDSNSYLLKSDNPYIVNCQLKPRLCNEAIQHACEYCIKNKILETNMPEAIWVKIFEIASQEAIKIILKKPKAC